MEGNILSCKVLIVDDEPQIHKFIRISLVAEGFEYLGATSIQSALDLIEREQPHLIVLDLGLPDGDGIELLTTVRTKSKTPILILTARDEEDEKIHLLEAGANDYLSKPFGIRELIVRIKVLVRDLVDVAQTPDILTSGNLTLQLSTNQLWLGNQEIALTKKEFSFLSILVQNAGKLVKQENLLEEIWGKTHTHDKHYLRILVSQLRKKLNDSADIQCVIKTESGLGYRFVVDLEN
ncbi:putative transcriptional regulatory protein KdpE [Photobacterium profundum SS9]|uniref:Transcriptional regulatory protein KdpE n=1 Tax=Photobacterium profundum (strain SS9) TaxID=298386 RepID=Q6LKF8_PHOPR|nr:putative transcriptional regulatory protein KdpE [Photobacterium profundum SS9]